MDSTHIYSSTSTQAQRLENIGYYPHSSPPNVDMQILAYSVIGGSDRHSVKQAEYAAFNNPRSKNFDRHAKQRT